jgi:ABC-type Fe3+/spermidine/putrescine transport system ATPase subunit
VVRAGDDGLVAVGGAPPIRVALAPGLAAGSAVQIAIRPESLQLVALPPGPPPEGTVPAKVADVTFLGNLTDCHVVLDDGSRVRVQLDPARVLEVGQALGLHFDADATSVFAA